MSTDNLQDKVKTAKVEGIVCVTLEIHLWTGKKRLRKDSLTAINPAFEDLPPETLATLGAIKVCDQGDLKPFINLRRRAEKLLDNFGLKVLGTMGIPEAKLEKVYMELLEIQELWNDLKADFEKQYNKRIEAWQEKNSEWAQLITNIPTLEQVAGRISFGFYMARVNAPSEVDGSGVNKMFEGQMRGLKGELFADAKKEAEIMMTRYLTAKKGDGVVTPREQITRKTLRPLYRIAEKFRSFGFVDASSVPLAEMIEHLLRLVPPTGPIEGSALLHIWSLCQILADPIKAMQAAEMALASSNPAMAFETMCGSTAGAASAEPTPEADNEAGKAAVEMVTITMDVQAPETAVTSDEGAQEQEDGFVQEPESASQPSFMGIF